MPYSPEYYKRHRKRIIERNRAWQKENSARWKAYLAAYFQKNRERILEANRERRRKKREGSE